MKNLIYILIIFVIGCGESPEKIKSVSAESSVTEYNGSYQGFVTWYDAETDRTHQSPYALKITDGMVDASGFAEIITNSELLIDSVMVRYEIDKDTVFYDSIVYEYSDPYFTRTIQTIQAEGNKAGISILKDYFNTDSTLRKRMSGAGELIKGN